MHAATVATIAANLRALAKLVSPSEAAPVGPAPDSVAGIADLTRVVAPQSDPAGLSLAIVRRMQETLKRMASSAAQLRAQLADGHVGAAHVSDTLPSVEGVLRDAAAALPALAQELSGKTDEAQARPRKVLRDVPHARSAGPVVCQRGPAASGGP